jgi:hypothetical protein
VTPATAWPTSGPAAAIDITLGSFTQRLHLRLTYNAPLAFSLRGGGAQFAPASESRDADAFLRQVAGGTPKLRLNARLKAASDS